MKYKKQKTENQFKIEKHCDSESKNRNQIIKQTKGQGKKGKKIKKVIRQKNQIQNQKNKNKYNIESTNKMENKNTIAITTKAKIYQKQ